jgi:hypothetical protein
VVVVAGAEDVVVGVVVTAVVVVAVPEVVVSVALGAVLVVSPPGAGTAVTVDVLVDVEAAVALAGASTAHATRLPASPVDMVCSSGPGLPSTE